MSFLDNSLSSAWKKAQNVGTTIKTATVNLSLMPFKTSRMLWNARPAFMRSAKNFIKPQHKYAVTDENLANVIVQTSASSGEAALKNKFEFECVDRRGGGHPGLVVTSTGDKRKKVQSGIIATNWQSGKPLAEIGLKYLGPRQT